MITYSYQKRLTLQGFGLSFLLAAILFLVTGQFLSFAVVPLGLIFGLSLGIWLDSRKKDTQPAVVSRKVSQNLIYRWLFHERLIIRVMSSLLVGTVLLSAAWAAGYYLLPEGGLLGPRTLEGGASAQPGAGMLVMEILGRNLIWIIIIPLINLLLVPSGFAYLIPFVWCVYYGLLLGTNSFVVPMPERLAPSLVIFERAGPFEMMAYLLAAAASYRRSTVPGWFNRIRQLSPSAWISLTVSLLLIIFAAVREAWMIAAR